MLTKLAYGLTIAAILAAVRLAQPVRVDPLHIPPDATATPTYAETVPGPGYTPVVRTVTPAPTATELPPTPTGWKMRYNCLSDYPCTTPTGLP